MMAIYKPMKSTNCDPLRVDADGLIFNPGLSSIICRTNSILPLDISETSTIKFFHKIFPSEMHDVAMQCDCDLKPMKINILRPMASESWRPIFYIRRLYITSAIHAAMEPQRILLILIFLFVFNAIGGRHQNSPWPANPLKTKDCGWRLFPLTGDRSLYPIPHGAWVWPARIAALLRQLPACELRLCDWPGR